VGIGTSQKRENQAGNNECGNREHAQKKRACIPGKGIAILPSRKPGNNH